MRFEDFRMALILSKINFGFSLKSYQQNVEKPKFLTKWTKYLLVLSLVEGVNRNVVFFVATLDFILTLFISWQAWIILIFILGKQQLKYKNSQISHVLNKRPI